jgi:hypothetical protein
MRDGLPELEAAVLAGSVSLIDDNLCLTRRMSPHRVKADRVAAVLRLEDSLHGLWERRSPAEIATDLGNAIEPLLAELAIESLPLPELQLDYDVPIRRLPHYAEVLARLQEGPLRRRKPWITSLPVHLGDSQFTTRLEGIVAGHILQLFDTGLRAKPEVARSLQRRLSRHSGIAFRYGVGTFERIRGQGLTDHRAWLGLGSSYFDRLAHCSGRWIFPAGQPYARWLREYDDRSG